MNAELQQKIERIVAMSERLSGLLQQDTASLESGHTRNLNTSDLTVQQLSLLFVRETAGVTAAVAKTLPKDVQKRLAGAIKRFNETLSMHQRVLLRMKTVSEGMIRAIATEVERTRVSQRTYAQRPSAKPVSTGAMIYNNVI